MDSTAPMPHRSSRATNPHPDYTQKQVRRPPEVIVAEKAQKQKNKDTKLLKVQATAALAEEIAKYEDQMQVDNAKIEAQFPRRRVGASL